MTGVRQTQLDSHQYEYRVEVLSSNPTPLSLNETDEWCDSLAPIAGARLGCPQKDKSGPYIDVRSIYVHAVEFSRTMAIASERQKRGNGHKEGLSH